MIHRVAGPADFIFQGARPVRRIRPDSQRRAGDAPGLRLKKKNERTKSAKLHFCRCSSHAHILYDGKSHFFPFSREKKRDNFQVRKFNIFYCANRELILL